MSLNPLDCSECWIEARAAELIAAVRRSRWKQDILTDARSFIDDGFLPDVALKLAADYWLN